MDESISAEKGKSLADYPFVDIVPNIITASSREELYEKYFEIQHEHGQHRVLSMQLATTIAQGTAGAGRNPMIWYTLMIVLAP